MQRPGANIPKYYPVTSAKRHPPVVPFASGSISPSSLSWSSGWRSRKGLEFYSRTLEFLPNPTDRMMTKMTTNNHHFSHGIYAHEFQCTGSVVLHMATMDAMAWNVFMERKGDNRPFFQISTGHHPPLRRLDFFCMKWLLKGFVVCFPDVVTHGEGCCFIAKRGAFLFRTYQIFNLGLGGVCFIFIYRIRFSLNLHRA